MTATVRPPRRRIRPEPHPSGRRTVPAKGYVECPVCEVPTGTLEPGGSRGLYTRLFANASGPEDGTRCTNHARTVVARSEESENALAWISDEDVITQLVHE